MAGSTTRLDSATALEKLIGETCPRCTGTLERGSFEGTVAVVCADCDTPAMRLWNVSSK